MTNFIRINDPLLAYPVGSIYLSVNSTDPGILFGGTWDRLTDTFLLAAGNKYPADDGTHTTATGGSEHIQAHTHSFTQPVISQDKGHKHQPCSNWWLVTNSDDGVYRTPVKEGTGAAVKNLLQSPGDMVIRESWTDAAGAHSHTASGGKVDDVSPDVSTGDAGNMPPYLAVYVWKRTR